VRVSFVSIARGCREQLFVRGKLLRLFTMFVSSIEARRAIDAVPQFSRDHHESCTCSGCLHVHVQHIEEKK
jgi:hypothetical protein